MASVTQDGATVIANDDFGGCGWIYTPGHKGNGLVPVTLARATRSKVKQLAVPPAVHTLVVTILATQAETDTFRDRLDSLYGGHIGTLSVPGYPSVSQTVFFGKPQWSEQMRADNLDGNETERYKYEVTLELWEL